MKKDELKRIRESNLPCQLIVGRYDRLARVGFVLRLAQKMKAPLLILGIFLFLVLSINNLSQHLEGLLFAKAYIISFHNCALTTGFFLHHQL